MFFRGKIAEKGNLEELLKGCSKGNIKAQENLFREYYGYAMSIALRYSNCHEKASEITNDSFLKVFRSIRFFNEKAKFKSWLKKIIINTALDLYRKEKKYKKQIPLQSGFDILADESVLDQLQAEDIMKMIQTLPVPYRFTFNLYEVEGYSHEEIAQKLGTTPGTSRANLSRAKYMLRQMILEQSEYERIV